MNRINKILVANRGEIAVRIIKTTKRLGIHSVGIYSKIDNDSLHVTLADESYCIGDVELSETYLNIPKIIAVAKQSGCDAIHPGYGFLAENPLFVEACEEAGIIFIGPDSRAMKMMGNKIEARAFARKINVPITEGLTGDKKTLMKAVKKIPYPVLLKAAAGGGGKGMQIVYHENELEEAIDSASRQAKAYFGDDTVYIEKYLEDPRHIEFQILGDNFGNVIHLFERECSIQRRYQKIIEESPSPTLSPEVRTRMGEAAVRIGKEIGYNNAGTIEFLVDNELNFYFLEMNTRIQVEHPVTELVTGIDIVEEQIHIASGHPMRLVQNEIHQTGHAIECRIYAEDPENNFQPSPGIMSLYKEPVLGNIRLDTGITANTIIKSSFDPMICKLIAWGKERDEARKLMITALDDYIIHGIRTNISYLKKLLRSEEFIMNKISTRFCDLHTADIVIGIKKDQEKISRHIPVIGYLLYDLHESSVDYAERFKARNLWETIGYWRNLMNVRLNMDSLEYAVEIPECEGNHYHFRINDEHYSVIRKSQTGHKLEYSINNQLFKAYISGNKNNQGFLSLDGHTFYLKRNDILAEQTYASTFESSRGDSNLITSPMPGKVIRIAVKEGDPVKKGDLLLIIEAMKMENMIHAPGDALVAKINVMLNDRVEATTALIILEKTD